MLKSWGEAIGVWLGITCVVVFFVCVAMMFIKGCQQAREIHAKVQAQSYTVTCTNGRGVSYSVTCNHYYNTSLANIWNEYTMYDKDGNLVGQFTLTEGWTAIVMKDLVTHAEQP